MHDCGPSPASELVNFCMVNPVQKSVGMIISLIFHLPIECYTGTAVQLYGYHRVSYRTGQVTTRASEAGLAAGCAAHRRGIEPQAAHCCVLSE